MSDSQEKIAKRVHELKGEIEKEKRAKREFETLLKVQLNERDQTIQELKSQASVFHMTSKYQH